MHPLASARARTHTWPWSRRLFLHACRTRARKLHKGELKALFLQQQQNALKELELGTQQGFVRCSRDQPAGERTKGYPARDVAGCKRGDL